MLNRTNGTSNVNVTLSWNLASCGVSVLPDLKVSVWDAVTAKWKDLGNGSTSGNSSGGTITSSIASTIYGPFTFGSVSAANALPIELVDFDATLISEQVEINWKTLSEINNDYFTIERSADGIYYESVSKIKGAGNSNTINSYTATDKHPLPGLSYYRLRQNDYDGATNYYNPKKIYNSEEGNLDAGPNPFSDVIRVNYFISGKENINVTLYDISGSVIYSESMTFSKENYTLEINSSSIKPGIYVLVISGQNKSPIKRKVVKL
jgi:hypothetical protein